MSIVSFEITNNSIVYWTVRANNNNKYHGSALLARFGGLNMYQQPMGCPHKWAEMQEVFPDHDGIIKQYIERHHNWFVTINRQVIDWLTGEIFNPPWGGLSIYRIISEPSNDYEEI